MPTIQSNLLDPTELLIECADALAGRAYDGGERQEHLRRIEDLQRALLSPHVAAILEKVATLFREHLGQNAVMLVLDAGGARVRRINDLRTELCQLASCPYVYHGTIRGRLASIRDEGLIPGKAPVWKERFAPRAYCDAAVFVSATWRAAAFWADTAHMHARGPRNGRHRQPVVIRIPRRNLPLQPDELGAAPGSLMIPGPVRVDEADVLLGGTKGFPGWVPLSAIER